MKGLVMQFLLAPQRMLLGLVAAFALLAGVLFATAPKASAFSNNCPTQSVCIYSGANGSGERSLWNQSEWGCHEHNNNSNIRSWVNNSGYYVRFGGRGIY